MDINEIMAMDNPQEKIQKLKNKTIEVPSWDDLQKEYDPRKHPVMTDPEYQPETRAGHKRQLTQVTLGLQKLATKRIAGLLFGIPVVRVYKPKNEAEQKAAEIMEAVFKKNRIDSVNIERAKMLYSCCEVATLWYTQEQDAEYAGEHSDLKLRCRVYSPKSGMALYPLFDEYDDMVAQSMEYSRKEDGTNVRYFDTYTNDRHIRWRMTSSSQEVDVEEENPIGKIPCVYMHREEPIWEDQSNNVYELEWTISRNGNYLRKNARPKWVVYSDKKITFNNEGNDEKRSRDVLQYPKDAKAGFETWEQATESLKFHVEELKKDYFMNLQLPDMSMENMKAVAMSGESRKMMFIDAQMKAGDESGIWLEAFDREINVVKAHLKNMFKNMAAAIDSLEVETRINPFQINDDGERISNLTNATGGKQIMSQKTAIKLLGEVDNVDEELDAINSETQITDVMDTLAE